MSIPQRRQEVNLWLQRAANWHKTITSAEETPTDNQVDHFYRIWNNLPARQAHESVYSWLPEPRTIWEPWQAIDQKAMQPPSLAEIRDLCARLGITNVAGFRGLIQVESNGSGFNQDGTLAMLFEGHLFFYYLGTFGIDANRIAASNPTICHRNWTRAHYLGGTREYTRLRQAIQIHPTAAKLSASWGLGQILGANHSLLDFPNPEAFVRFSAKSQLNQIEAIGRFLRGNNIIGALNRSDWHTVARVYNGPAYASHGYHTRLAQAASRFTN